MFPSLPSRLVLTRIQQGWGSHCLASILWDTPSFHWVHLTVPQASRILTTLTAFLLSPLWHNTVWDSFTLMALWIPWCILEVPRYCLEETFLTISELENQGIRCRHNWFFLVLLDLCPLQAGLQNRRWAGWDAAVLSSFEAYVLLGFIRRVSYPLYSV